MYKRNIKSVIMAIVLIAISTIRITAQQVEVQGELKVSQMPADNTEENLVTRKSDGTLGTRSVNSLSSPGIDTTRNLASDFELAKHLCNCQSLPPFMIKNLLDSGYTPEQLVGSGLPVEDVINAQRGGILIDPRDNQAYKTVTIGTQTWMAENLNFGTRIDGISDQTDNNIIEKYCYGDLSSNCDTYGGLYQWDEMMQYTTTAGTQGICPTGWHLPKDDEWKILEMALGMSQSQADASGLRGTDQGSQLAGDESLWLNGLLDENGVFGSSGFNILPAGYYYEFDELFSDKSFGAYLWTSSEDSTYWTWMRILSGSNSQVSRDLIQKKDRLSVRCVKD